MLDRMRTAKMWLVITAVAMNVAVLDAVDAPILTVTPGPSVVVGTRVVFKVTHPQSNSQNFQYQIKFGSTTKHPTNADLVIDSATTADAGQYKSIALVVPNQLPFSNVIELKVTALPETPKLDVQFTNKFLKIGTRQIFECLTESRGNLQPQYIFLKDGTPYGNASPQPYIVKLELDHTGKWTCRAKIGNLESADSPERALTVFENALIFSSNSPAVFEDGESLRLQCDTRTLGPKTHYTFTKDGSPVQEDSVSSEFNVPSVTIADSGRYRCKVYISNSIWTPFSIAVFVKVTPITPTLTVSPSTAVIGSGTTVTFTCSTASSGATTYQFLQEGAEQVSQSSGTYTVASATTHTGAWTCTATASIVSNASPPQKVTVLETPKTPTLTVSPSTAVIESGTSVTFTCSTASSGATTYKFLKDGAEQVSQSSGTYTVTSATTLTGAWTCTATIDTIVSSASSPQSVTVLEKPTISSTKQIMYEGETVSLTCSSSGEGITSYSFYRNGQVLATSGQSSHSLDSVTASDAGEYTCTAKSTGHDSPRSDAITVDVLPKGQCMTGCGNGTCINGTCDYCHPNQCSHGECVPEITTFQNGSHSHFFCECDDGYMGDYCQDLIDDPCRDGNICKNGATCEVKIRPDANDWVCNCVGDPVLGQAKDCSINPEPSYALPEPVLVALGISLTAIIVIAWIIMCIVECLTLGEVPDLDWSPLSPTASGSESKVGQESPEWSDYSSDTSEDALEALANVTDSTESQLSVMSDYERLEAVADVTPAASAKPSPRPSPQPSPKFSRKPSPTESEV